MNEIKLFESQEIRSVYHNDEWYFVVVDVVSALTESKDSSQYIRRLRQRDEELNKGWVQIVLPLSVETKGGKQKINCANKEGIFRIIQSIPSKKAEPFKRWLAKTASDVIDEKTNKRLAAYKKLKESQKRLLLNVKERGVDEEGFKKIVEDGDSSLFGGIDVKQKYQIEDEENADDFMNSLLLYGKGFATEITNHNTSKENLQGENDISNEHQSNNDLIRSNLLQKNIIPEDLPPEEKLKQSQLEKKKQNKLDK
ncbi:BRO family protein [Chondrinema litorale]|uniref:BRO family protein n=1 Tax=Chondrinema litorale TaxID=2994555 RepID=UPI002542E4BB|nr:BRO family protein [Chondrinema litorale]UZR99435.1 BRO family protein [Chondrinema litorale]